MEKYFFDNEKNIGLKADIKRHNEEEKELISKYNSAQLPKIKKRLSQFPVQTLFIEKCSSRKNWYEKAKMIYN